MSGQLAILNHLCESLRGCLSPRGPAIDWQPVQGVRLPKRVCWTLEDMPYPVKKMALATENRPLEY